MCLFLTQALQTDLQSHEHTHTMETTAFRTRAAIRFSIPQFWNNLKAKHLKGSLSHPCRRKKKSHIDWSKIRRGLQKTTMDGKAEIRAHRKKHWLSTWTCTSRVTSREGEAETPQIRETPPPAPSHVTTPLSLQACLFKCFRSLRPNASNTASVPVLWLQAPLVSALHWHLSSFPCWAGGRSLACSSQETHLFKAHPWLGHRRSLPVPGTVQSTWKTPLNCLWNCIVFIRTLLLLNEFTCNKHYEFTKL